MNRGFIGTLAKQASVPIKTIRYYEEVGLLPRATRTAAGYRLYSSDAVDRLQFIKKAQSLGLRLEEIKEILDLADRGRCPCGHVQHLLKFRLRELNRKIADLHLIERREPVFGAGGLSRRIGGTAVHGAWMAGPRGLRRGEPGRD